MNKHTLLTRLIAFLLAAWLVGCGKGASPEPSFEVDPSLGPDVEAISFADGSGERPIASIADDKGNQADFVENEVIVALENRSELAGILERLNATVLREVDPSAEGAPEGLPSFFLLAIDPAAADPAELVDLVLAGEAENGAAHRVSSEAALNTLAAMGHESVDHGTQLGANFLLKFDSLSERETAEASSDVSARPDYTPNAFDWPYMNRGSNQDIGAAEAARMVHDAGRASRIVDFMIYDGGFSNAADFPSATIMPAGSWNIPNPTTCSGGSPCPWHGTQVASAAMSVFDDGIGGAGPASEVVRPIFVQTPNANFWDYLEFVFQTVPRSLGRRPDIVNISASADVPAGACLLGACIAMDVIGRAVRRAGILVFASAGNDGRNVDADSCFIACWEDFVRVPCEVSGVVCVGGLEHDSNFKAANSARGSNSRGEGDSVDIYAPYRTWVHQTPTASGSSAQFVSGTSFSSPFAASIAALIKAADPSLGAGDVWRVLKETAHTKERGDVHRWVNAFGAVLRALGGNAPPFVQIMQPDAGDSFSLSGASVPLNCDLDDDDMGTVSMSWISNRDGLVSTRAFSGTTHLSEGPHLLTCSATDGEFTVSDTVEIDIVNDPPTVEILQPTRGDYFHSQPIPVAARAIDINFDLASVSWSVSMSTRFGPVPLWTGTGETTTVPGRLFAPGVYTLQVRATDTHGRSGFDSMTLVIAADPADLPPSILSPRVFATFGADEYDHAPTYFWIDACTVDMTGDGRVDSADACQRLTFTATVTDDHDASSALRYRWEVRQAETLIDTDSTSSARVTFDLPYGSYEVTLIVEDSAGNTNDYTWTLRVDTLI